MKKFLTLGIALMSMALFSSCGEEDGPSGDAAGTYIVNRTINMRTPPIFPFTPVKHETKITIKSENENFIKVVLPGATYKLNGEVMKLPTITLSHIPVLSDGKGGVKILRHDFSQKIGKKHVIGNIKGEVEADRDLELDVEFKYGSMPYYMIQEYETPDRD